MLFEQKALERSHREALKKEELMVPSQRRDLFHQTSTFKRVGPFQPTFDTLKVSEKSMQFFVSAS